MLNLGSSLKRSFLETKDSYGQIIRQFAYLSYIGLPVLILTLLTDPVAYAIIGVSFTSENLETVMNEFSEPLFMLMAFVFIHLLYSLKVFRAWYVYWLEGADSLKSYNHLLWSVDELRFLKTGAFYFLVIFLVAIVGLVVYVVSMALLGALLSVLLPKEAFSIAMAITTALFGIALFLFLFHFMLSRGFVIPAKAVGRSMKMKEAKVLCSGHIRGMVSTMLLTIMPVWFFTLILQQISMTLGEGILPSVVNTIGYVFGFVMSMLISYIVARYYEIITRN